MAEKQQAIAAVFALLNDFRLSREGGNSLGFINPLIYSRISSGFTDIVSGSNPGCGTEGKIGLVYDDFLCLFTFAFHFQQVLPQSKVGTQ